MTLRRQLPVYSPISFAGLVAAAAAAVTGRTASRRAVASQLRDQYASPRVVLTDSGTSALVLALRLAVGKGKVVAIPGYACIDVAAAARFANVRVRIYDIEPNTLSPDLESLEATLARGADALLVAHLYGYPCDMDAVVTLAERYGVPLIEDAAQAAGATYQGRPLGAFGALSIFSFGRGKGVTGGRGGALLTNDSRFDEPLESAVSQFGRPPNGGSELLIAAAQWTLGRPSLYGIPSRIPMLRLGETVFRAAHEPRPISASAAALVATALQAAPTELNVRTRAATVLSNAVEEGGDIASIAVVEKGIAGFLRFPILDSGQRSPRMDLGILRGYPRSLLEQEELRACLLGGAAALPGADQLCRSLFTLPTHGLVRNSDLEGMIEWLRVPTRVVVPALAKHRELNP